MVSIGDFPIKWGESKARSEADEREFIEKTIKPLVDRLDAERAAKEAAPDVSE